MTTDQQSIKEAKDKEADNFFRKLCARGFRDQDKGLTGGHRNPRPIKKKREKEHK